MVLEKVTAGHRGPDNKIQNSLAIKYKHAMFLWWGRGRKKGYKGEEAVLERGYGGPTPPCCAPPPHPDPFPLCLWVRVSVWACVRTSPIPSPPQIPTPTPPPLIAAIPVAAGCHSAVTPLPIVFRGGKEGGREGEKPSPALPPPSPTASTRSPGGGKSRGHSIL